MGDDLAGHIQRKLRRGTLVAACNGHHRRRDNEMRGVFEADDERHRHRRLFAERQKRNARAHIADIAVTCRETLDRRFSEAVFPDKTTDQEHNQENAIGTDEAGGNEIHPRQFFHRRFRHQLEKQRRQRRVDDEGVQPAHRLDRLFRDARSAVADQDEAEKRQQQSHDVSHYVSPASNSSGRLSRFASGSERSPGTRSPHW